MPLWFHWILPENNRIFHRSSATQSPCVPGFRQKQGSNNSGFLGFDFRRLHHHRIPVRLRPPAVNSVCQHAIIMTDSGRKNKCRGLQNCPAVDNHTELVDNFPANTVSGNPGSVTVVLRRKGTPCPFRSLLFHVETA